MEYETISWPTISLNGGAFAFYSVMRGIEKHIRVLPTAGGCAPMHIRIYGCRMPRVKAPANAVEANSAPRTRNFVDWIQTQDQPWNEGEIVRTPDLTPITREIMNLLGWARGCAMLFFFKNMAATDIIQELPGYSEHIANPDTTHGWLRESYLRDEHDSLLVLE